MWRKACGLFEGPYEITARQSAKRRKFSKTWIVRKVVKKAAGDKTLLHGRKRRASPRSIDLHVPGVYSTTRQCKMSNHRRKHVVGEERRCLAGFRQERI